MTSRPLLSWLVILGNILCAFCSNGKPSGPLYLTHYVTSGRIEDGQRESEVRPFLKGIKSYSGYLTVDSRYNSNLFFWYFPSKTSTTQIPTPLIIWLQGGPGSSSLYGLFTENGPYEFKKGKLDYREYTWTKDFNVLYIDNPVGTGFSFTENEKGYATDQTEIGERLHEALRQFLILFPNLQKSKIIISGESYAGKYIPSLAYTILNKRNTTNPSINIEGLFIGNPMISPEHMLNYNQYFYSHGLLDAHGRGQLKEREELMKNKIKAGKWKEAGELMDSTFFGMEDSNTLFYQLTGMEQYFNLLKDKNDPEEFTSFLNQPRIRKALHVGNRRFARSTMKVYHRLQEDVMKSMKPIFETVLENYQTLIFSGQLDGICPWYLQENLFLHLSWNGAWEYYHAERKPFHLNQKLVGYYKRAKNFTDVMIRNAGHMVPRDKPQWALDLLHKFSKGYFRN